MKPTARLERWSYDPYYNCYWGNIHDDSRKRWPDGTCIHTSSVKEYKDKKGDVVATLNSYYLLGEPIKDV